MKIENMKVSELLKEKRDLDSKIISIINALGPVRGEKANGYNYNDRGTVRIFCGGYSVDSTIDKDLLLGVLLSQLERLESEVEPINKKLDAIEMILNS